MSDIHSLYTIGHSSLELGRFLAILNKCGVGMLVDVRSQPRSARFPHFSQEALEPAVCDAGIAYLALGEELGGRPGDAKLYRADGLVDYAARRKCHDFQGGVERVLSALETVSPALMCAEEDPLACHRFLLIGPALMERGVELLHIRKGGVVETQREAEDRLLKAHAFSDVTSGLLFPDIRQGALEDAYRKQAEKYAFRADPQLLGEF